MDKLPIIIDCDPGIDDALAIILALHHPGLDLRAVSTVAGNCSLDKATRNALKVLTLCGRQDIPVYAGADRALDGRQPDPAAAHGDDGLGGYAHTVDCTMEPQARSAVDFLTEAARRAPGELTLFATGPCTNVAHAVRRDPSFAKNVKRLIIMGGGKYTGNVTPVAEYNFWADSLAAKEVLAAGFPDVTVVGLDVTNQIALSGDLREAIRIVGTPLARFVYDITRVGLEENWLLRQKPVAPMHDVLTVAYCLQPGLLTLRSAHVDVVDSGIAKGQSVVDFDGHFHDDACNAKFAVDVDVVGFYRLLLSTVFPDQARAFGKYLDRLGGKRTSI